MVDDGEAVGILLAAGAGTRFGEPKVLAADGDWLRIAVHALADGGCGSGIRRLDRDLDGFRRARADRTATGGAPGTP